MTLRKHAHALYRDFLSCKKNENFYEIKFDIFLIFAQNVCFGAKIRKLETPLHTPPPPPQFYYVKVGYKVVFISRTCFPDEKKTTTKNGLVDSEQVRHKLGCTEKARRDLRFIIKRHYTFLYPPQNEVLGGYTVFSLSVIP